MLRIGRRTLALLPTLLLLVFLLLLALLLLVPIRSLLQPLFLSFLVAFVRPVFLFRLRHGLAFNWPRLVLAFVRRNSVRRRQTTLVFLFFLLVLFFRLFVGLFVLACAAIVPTFVVTYLALLRLVVRAGGTGAAGALGLRVEAVVALGKVPVALFSVLVATVAFSVVFTLALLRLSVIPVKPTDINSVFHNARKHNEYFRILWGTISVRSFLQI